MSDKEYADLIRELEGPDGAGKMQCPCCKYYSLPQRGAGEKCKWCGWHDYPGQNEYYPDKILQGRNFDLSLKEAQREWEAYYSLNPADYTPNEVPLKKRVINVALALLVMAYSGYSLWAGRFVMAGSSRGKVEVITFVGIEVWIMSAACLSAAAFGVLSVIDHFDRRRNERGYRKIVAACFVLMAAMMGLAMTSFFYREYGVGGAIAGCIFIVIIVSAIIYRIKNYGPIEY